MSKQLSDTLGKTLVIIQRLTRENGASPTLKEIAKELDISLPSVFAQLQRLKKSGYIDRSQYLSRSIRILRDVPGASPDIRRMVQVPIVGQVAAGSPILAEENIIGHIPVEEELAKKKGSLFGLKVKGDSMIGAKIKSGDCVIVRQQPLAENGDIVVALLDNEGVVKRLSVKNDSIELISENPKYKPIHIERGDEFRIVGKVVSIYHLQDQEF